MRKSILLSTAVSILLAGTAAAQDGTDTCTTPTPIGEGAFAFDSSTMASSAGLAEGACGTLAFNQDMFWVYTATLTGDVIFDTEGSTFDTQIAVYAGIDCAAICVDQDDDGGSGLLSKVTVTGVTPGDTFVVQVGGFGTNAGPGSLNIAGPPPAHPNDDCSSAAVIAGTGAFAFDSTGATSTGFAGGGGVCATSINQDIYMQWTAPADGDFIFDTFGTGFDTKLAVHNGMGCAATCGDYNDDTGGLQSEVNLAGLLMGDSVLVQVGGFSAGQGPGTLNITQAPDGSDCSLGLPITGAGAFAYDTTGNVTTGFDGGGSCAGGASSVNQDMFFVWTADAAGVWQIDTELTAYDTKLSVHDGIDCLATCLAYDDDGGVSTTSLITLTVATAGDTFLIQVGGFSTNEGPGTLTIAPAVDPCDPMNEDAFEDNDTCATAWAITPGTYTDLFATDADTDWFSISIPAGEILTVTLSNTLGDIDFDVLASDCVTSFGLPTGSWTINNTGAVALDIVFNAFNDSIGGGPCSIYDLDIVIAPDPCSGAADDAFEDNDDCATATAMVDGTYPGLLVTTTDEDYYAFCVGNGDTVSIDLLFINANGDLDGFLRAASSVECGGGHGAPELLAEGWSASDNENITWTNTTGADLDVVLQVQVFGTAPPCNNYDLVITGSGNCNGYLGSMYCTAEMNSTGAIAQIYGTGDIVAANNAFGLLSTNLPDGEFAYFIGSYGQAQVNNPGGSNGNLCVGGGMAIARFLPTLGMIAGGQIAGSVDLTNVPLPPTFAGMIMAGDTFNFQCWNREGGPLSGMSNFSLGLEVTFE